MKKIYYITKSYLPGISGGIQMRVAAVNLLRKQGWSVIVITPNYNSNKIIETNDVIKLPAFIKGKKILFFKALEKIGLVEDYLDLWVKSTFKYLKSIIQKDDILFCTTGGELATLKLGSLLKKEISCKYIANYRDPVFFTKVNGYRLKKLHVHRDKMENKYLKNVDLVITSSKSNMSSLLNKYPNLQNKIFNNYFGYIKQTEPLEKSKSEKLRIAYAGNFGSAQKPEILAEITKHITNIEVYFIGNHESYKPLKQYKNDSKYHFINSLPHADFINFMNRNIDIGFVSLTNNFYGACVPSKIYEYINLGLPIFGALPNGDAQDLINMNKYGVANDYTKLEELKKGIKKIIQNYDDIKSKVINDRDKWYMGNTILELCSKLEKF